MARVDVGVLGPLTVARDGERAPVPSGLATKLVVILAAGRAHGATDEQLLERLWADPIPFAALASLRNTVSRLRKLLGDDVLARTATGYALGPDVAVDLDRLEEHHARARAAAATGDRAAARRQLDAALGLVRGEPLADVAGDVWAAPDVSYWTELIADLGDRWIELAAEDVDATAVPRARELAVARPDRESRWVGTARLLTATGRRADALRVLRQARRELAEFGLDPGRHLVAAEREALADRVGGSPLPPPGRTGAFVGRRRELADLRRAVAEAPLVTVVGLGGVGKTRLATELTLAPGLDFPGGVTFVDLSAVDDGALVLGEVTDAAGIRRRPGPGDDAVAQLGEVLGAAPSLLVLDNAEQVAAAVSKMVADLLGPAAAGGSRLLVTSRVPLGADGERVLALAPLAVPDDGATLAEIAANPAVELLAELTGPIERPDDRRAAARLVRAVAGMPLGLELAAGVARELPLTEVADGLDDRILELGAGEGRLRQVFRWVAERLDVDDLRVLARLSAFQGPFTLRSATAVVDQGDLVGPVVASLGRLRAAGLVSLTGRRPVTYRLDAVQRAYAAELLAAEGGTAAAQDRVARWYRSLVRELAPAWRGAGQREAIELVAAELTNIRELLHRLPATDPAAALDLAGGLGEFCFLQGYWVEGAGWLDDALAAAPEPSPARAAALVGRARAGGTYARLGGQDERLAEAVELAEAYGRPDLAQEARLWRALARLRAGAGVEDVLTIAALADDARFPWVAALARMLTGLGAVILGQLDAGREMVHDAADQFRALGDELAAADAHKNLGLMLQRHGDPDEARRELHDAGLLAGAAAPALVAQARYARAAIEVDDGRRDAEVVDELRAVRVDLRRVGDTTCLGGCNRLLAGLVDTEDEALALLRDVLPRLGADDEHELGLSLVEVADRYLGAGRGEDAALLAAAATALQSGTGYGWNRAQRAHLAALTEATAPAQVGRALEADRTRLVRRAVRVAMH